MIFESIVLIFSFVIAPLLASSSVTKVGYLANKEPSWGYDYGQSSSSCPQCSPSSQCGPACWWNVPLNQNGVNLNSCSGTEQSPVNIDLGTVDKSLKFPDMVTSNGGCNSWSQFANAFVFEVSFHDHCDNMKLTYNDVEYTLYQFHFHSPSEHSIGGGFYDGELHMVHVNNDEEEPKVLVLGVLLTAINVDRDNDFLSIFWDVAENYNVSDTSDNIYSYMYDVADNEKAVNAYESFLPASKDYFTYTGSFTTWPCTEGVTWIEFQEPMTIGPNDLQNLKDAVQYYPYTNSLEEYNYDDYRPVQNINDRVVKYYSAGTDQDDDNDHSGITKNIADAALAIAIICLTILVLLLIFFARSSTSEKNMSMASKSEDTDDKFSNAGAIEMS